MADSGSIISSKNSEKSKLSNLINRTTSETLRLNDIEKSVNSPNSLSTNAPRKKTSFQITSVIVGSRASNDGGDDSADDLDESHAEDISEVLDNSRITDLENETPSYSEDTFSKDDVFFNASSSLVSAPVIPTSSQYGLAIVATPEHSESAVNQSDNCEHSDSVNVSSVDVTDNVINLGVVSTKHDPEMRDMHPPAPRTERFKVVKIESTEPFKRGRWVCMDYLDHNIAQKEQPSVKSDCGESLTSGTTETSSTITAELPCSVNTTVEEQPLAQQQVSAEVVSAPVPNMQANESTQVPLSSAPSVVPTSYPSVSPGQSLQNSMQMGHVVNTSTAPVVSQQSQSLSQGHMQQILANSNQHQSLQPQQMQQVLASANVMPIQQQPNISQSMPQQPVIQQPIQQMQQMHQVPQQYQSQTQNIPQQQQSVPQPIPQQQQGIPQQQQSIPQQQPLPPQQSMPNQQQPMPQQQQNVPQQQPPPQQPMSQPQQQPLPQPQQQVMPPQQNMPQQQPLPQQQQQQQTIPQQQQQTMPQHPQQTMPQQQQPMPQQQQQGIPQQQQTMSQQGIPQHQQAMPQQQQMPQQQGMPQQQQPLQQQQFQPMQQQQPMMQQQMAQQPMQSQMPVQQVQMQPGVQQMSMQQPQQNQQSMQQQQQIMQQPMQQMQQQQPTQMHQVSYSQPPIQTQQSQQVPGMMPQMHPQQMQSYQQGQMMTNIQPQPIMNIQSQPHLQPQYYPVSQPMPSGITTSQAGMMTQGTMPQVTMQGSTPNLPPLQTYASVASMPPMQVPNMPQTPPIPTSVQYSMPHIPQTSQQMNLPPMSMPQPIIPPQPQPTQQPPPQHQPAQSYAGISSPAQSYTHGMSSSSVPSAVMMEHPVVNGEHTDNPTAALIESLNEVTASADEIQPGEDAESTSGTNAVAIDNKIEQAMDLVKSHLMYAVREEVEVLKEKISELMERIGQLEAENATLRAGASPETLALISNASQTNIPTNP